MILMFCEAVVQKLLGLLGMGRLGICLHHPRVQPGCGLRTFRSEAESTEPLTHLPLLLTVNTS